MRSPRVLAVATLAAIAMSLSVLHLTQYAPVRAQNPLHTLLRDPQESALLRGRVEERLAAGGYTYLALRARDGALLWTVTLGGGAPIGAEVRMRSLGRQRAFHSRRLDRTFPELIFGIVSRTD